MARKQRSISLDGIGSGRGDRHRDRGVDGTFGCSCSQGLMAQGEVPATTRQANTAGRCGAVLGGRVLRFLLLVLKLDGTPCSWREQPQLDL